MKDTWIGRDIDGCDILDVIGSGGMAVVYRGWQRSMGRSVAVKVLPRQFLDEAVYLQRFEREVQIAAQLEHRGIVPVYDHGSIDGQPFIVMRYLSGGSLDDRLARDRRMEVRAALTLVQQIAPALDYAHSKGVLHRDLKPSNILLDEDGGAYLTDFGIARILGDEALALTTQGVVGTAAYMSPEQAQGRPLDARSDIYALGITLFEILTGSRPFDADTPYSVAVLQVTAQPPSMRAINPAISAAVERVVLKALEKNPAHRYATAVDLAAALALAVDPPPMTLQDTQPVSRGDLNAAAALAESDAINRAAPPSSVLAAPKPQNLPMMRRAAVEKRRRAGGGGWSWLVIGIVSGCGMLTAIGIGIWMLLGTGGRSAAVVPTSALLNEAVPITPPVTATPDAPLTDSIVYMSDVGGSFDLYRLNLATRAVTQLTNDASYDNLYPAVSPDGQQIVFMSDRDGGVFNLYRINRDGAGLRRLTNSPTNDRFPAWSRDGKTIVFSRDARQDDGHDLYQLRLDDGGVRPIYEDAGRSAYPVYTPDDRAILFTHGGPNNAGTWELLMIALDDGDVTPLTINAVKDWAADVARDDDGDLRIVYSTEGEGFAAIAEMTIAPDGTIRQPPRTLYDGPGYDWAARLHPRGDHLLFTAMIDGRDNLYLLDLRTGEIETLTTDGALYGVWLPARE